MTVTKLSSSGYWHVRFNQNQFVQWPVGGLPSASDTFGFFVEDKEGAASCADLLAGLYTLEELRDDELAAK